MRSNYYLSVAIKRKRKGHLENSITLCLAIIGSYYDDGVESNSGSAYIKYIMNVHTKV